MRNKFISITQSLRLPSICVLCNQFHHNSLAVCDECIALIPVLGPSCTNCAYPLFNSDYPVCGYCIKNPPHFDSTTIIYRFEEPLRSLLHRFKYRNELYLGPFLGQLILNAWQQNPTKPQCLLPVPMYPKKIKARGFNQTMILTRFLAKRLAIPYDFSHCKKIKNTPSQAQLDGKERINNMREAFKVKKLPYTHVALIDDLLTTGSTANELAANLKNSGVEKVELWSCARTIKK